MKVNPLFKQEDEKVGVQVVWQWNKLKSYQIENEIFKQPTLYDITYLTKSQWKQKQSDLKYYTL